MWTGRTAPRPRGHLARRGPLDLGCIYAALAGGLGARAVLVQGRTEEEEQRAAEAIANFLCKGDALLHFCILSPRFVLLRPGWKEKTKLDLVEEPPAAPCGVNARNYGVNEHL